ncbi:hypothetical protein L484_025398 [Morus notabilis]|uniref:Uncharacterized protein n=1 Tax=Morus notabilis TaxID=981085 RepID=W9RAI2_9ROSA|nr:hypothetical protein L484_025398 [Morus notabilis]
MVEALICLKILLNARDEEYEPVVLRQYMDEVESYEDCYEVVADDSSIVPPSCSSTNQPLNPTPDVPPKEFVNVPMEEDK